MSRVTMLEMFQAGAHFGHHKKYWNPQMAPYIFGTRKGVHIINLEKSLPLFHDALNFAGSVVAGKGTVLFVGTKRAAGTIVREQATRCGMPYVDHRWLGGMLTNFKTIKQSIKQLKELTQMEEDGSLNKLTKKEGLLKLRSKAKLERSLGGIQNMRKMPDAMFVIDVGYEEIAIQEANKLDIPTIGVVDSNADISSLDYLIPGNDDAIRSIELYCSAMADAILDAKASIVGSSDEFEEVQDELDSSGVTVVEKKAATPAVETASTAAVTPEPAEKKAAEQPPATVEVAEEKPSVKKKATATKSTAKTAIKKSIAKDDAEAGSDKDSDVKAEKAPTKKPAAKKPAVKATAKSADASAEKSNGSVVEDATSADATTQTEEEK